MKVKRIILKIFTWVVIVAVGGGMLTLLVAANRKQKAGLCKDIIITVNGTGEQLFIDKNDILQTVNKTAGGSVLLKPVGQVRLANLELALEKNAWIRDAEVYFDSRDVLHVQVNEREPIARIFTTNGRSFYIDSSGAQMPLLFKESARVLVVTNFTGAYRYNAADSAMAKDVKNIAWTIYKDPFWKQQIAQLDITAKGNFEAIPVIGNHIIRLGNADNIETKLKNLFLFYKQVLAKTGFDKYAAVDVQYRGQVVGIHHGATSAVDSLQLQRNIEELLSRSNLMANDTAISAPVLDSARRRLNMITDSSGSDHNENRLRTVNAVADSTHLSRARDQRPRAVMPAHRNE